MAIAQEFSFQDLIIRWRGQNVTGAQGVSYTTSQESPNIYGQGREPRAYSKKKREYEASVTMTGGQLRELIRTQGITLGRSKNLTGLLPFEVVVTRANEQGDVWTDILVGNRVTEVTIEYNLDDDFAEIEIPITPARIDYDTVA